MSRYFESQENLYYLQLICSDEAYFALDEEVHNKKNCVKYSIKAQKVSTNGKIEAKK